MRAGPLLPPSGFVPAFAFTLAVQRAEHLPHKPGQLLRGMEMCGVSGEHMLDAARETVLWITSRFPELHDKGAPGRKRRLINPLRRRRLLFTD